MDGNEEQLKFRLLQLEKVAFDPMLSGRQEEVWARMSVLRERAEQLKKEADNLAKQIDSSKEGPLDPEQTKKIEQILNTYEAQLNQLKKERESAEADFVQWQTGTQPLPKR